MTAMPNDVLRVKEIDRLIDDLHRRLDAFNLDERTVLSPETFEEEALADLLFIDMYHILEEASNLSFETQSSYPDIPWTQIRGMRNRSRTSASTLTARLHGASSRTTSNPSRR